MSSGILDTNVLIHAYTRDAQTAECVHFLEGVQSGSIRVLLDPLVLHELSSALSRYIKGITRQETLDFMRMILAWKGIEGEKELITEAIRAWGESPRLGFVDAFLAAKARQLDCAIYTKNIRDFENLGVNTPDPLPAG